MADGAVAELIEIWPAPGRERVAVRMGAQERDGGFWIDPTRTDSDTVTLRRMFGSVAAKTRREAALNPATPAISAEPPTPIPAAAPMSTLRDSGPRTPSLQTMLFGAGDRWRWSKGAEAVGGHAGESFVVERASMLPGDKPRLELVVQHEAGQAHSGQALITINADPADIPGSLERSIKAMIEDPDLALTRQAHESSFLDESEIDGLQPDTAIFDAIVASAGGARGTAIEWLEDVIDRPNTGARSGMRAVIISGSVKKGPVDSQAISINLDYRGFTLHNTALAAALGVQPPRQFENVTVTLTPAEGDGLQPVIQKLNRIMKITERPERQIAPDHISAARLRKEDDRLKLAAIANAEVVARGETPPAPLPPVNPDPAATRIYFWTAREETSPYCYKHLIAAAKDAGVPLLCDRNKASDFWGLRYVEGTAETVAALPETMKVFLSEDAVRARTISLAKRNSTRDMLADAAATAALEVTTRNDHDEKALPAGRETASSKTPDDNAKTERADKGRTTDLYPLSVPHPDHDRNGWMVARKVIENIGTEKLIELVKLTSKMHDDLKIARDMRRTTGDFDEDLEQDDNKRLSMWWHGMNLGKGALKDRGIDIKSLEQPDKTVAKEVAPERTPSVPQQRLHLSQRSAPSLEN